MNKQTINKIVPKLRFPEFRDTEAWKKKQLKNVCQMHAGKFVSASEISENKKDDLFPCYGGNGLRGYTKSNTHTGKYSLIGRQGALCGNITFATDKFHATEHAVVVTPKVDVDTDWLFYMLINLNLNQYATGQAQPGLSVENLEKVDISIPGKEKEQQKIATCLSSIDELIIAQSQKLDTLKVHKKGLMQQLFPAEDDAFTGSARVPKLRFAEFRDDGEWEEKQLGNLGEFTGGGTPSKANDSFWKGSIPWVSSSDIFEDSIHQIKISRFITEEALKDSATKLVPENSILIVSRVGVGKLAITKQPVCTSQDFTNFTPDIDNLMFLAYILKSHSKTLLKYSQGMAIKGFTKDDISKLNLFIPHLPEQQKIADCLSSLDELIAAQSQKLDALKTHKKGLMQGLFPGIMERG
ncbi:MAG: restriction endonuclease subunit S [Bacteroidota bacterium]|nr:restriction endonuclease subunit S [Bacteroidota bacterium]